MCVWVCASCRECSCSKVVCLVVKPISNCSCSMKLLQIFPLLYLADTGTWVGTEYGIVGVVVLTTLTVRKDDRE